MNFVFKVLKFVESLHYIISQIYNFGIPYRKAILKSSKTWPGFKYLGFTKTNLNIMEKYLNKIKLRD